MALPNKAATYKHHLLRCFEHAEKGVSNVTDEILALDGMTGTLTRHFYNNLMSMPDARYLEIGTWKGSSVCSAMCGNRASVLCIDNWSEFEGPKEEFMTNFFNYKGENDALFVEADCFQVDVSNFPKFNVYLYDGEHSEDSHYKALLHYISCLDDIFIFIVDDWNWQTVRDGTFSSFEKLNLKVLFEKEIRLTHDDTHTPAAYAKQSWWNGIYVAILQKPSAA